MAESEGRNENNNNFGKNDDNDICRDFLRNLCRRGSNCKYRHPEPQKETQEEGSQDIKFCHDFQNKGCRRANCKFMHCTKREEEYYQSTGKLPRHVQEALGEKIDVPVCKDFLRGFCKRGIYCKFRHLTVQEYEMEMGGKIGPSFVGEQDFNRFDDFEFQLKRKRPAFDDGFGPVDGPGVLLPTPGPDRMPSTSMPDIQMLEGENAILRRKVEELKKQVVELTSTVEYLLEQNAQLRASKQFSMPPSTPNSPPKSRSIYPGGGLGSVQSW